MNAIPASKNEEGRILTALVMGEGRQQRAMLCQALGSRYPVLCAFSEEDGLRIAENAKPDVIILDLAPDGGTRDFTALRELRNHPCIREIAVVALTTADENTTPNQALSRGRAQPAQDEPLTCFLEKPVSPERLCHEVSLLIGNNAYRIRQGRNFQ